MNCPICHAEVKPGHKYCAACAAKLDVDVFGKGLTDPKSRLRKTGDIYATILQRALATMLDVLILAGTWLMFYGLMSLMDSTMHIGAIRWQSALFVFCSLTWLYFAGFESSELMATPGKVALGLVVLNLKGKPLEFGQATARNLLKLLSLVTLLIGFLMMLMSPLSQTLHDKLAKCVVIKKDPYSHD